MGFRSSLRAVAALLLLSGAVTASARDVTTFHYDNKRTGWNPQETTLTLDNVKPEVEVRSKRVGGAAYQVPMQVNRVRQQSLAIRWILMAVREKKGRGTHEKLAEELLAAYKREGAAVTKRDNVHRMADANKAFAHFAW